MDIKFYGSIMNAISGKTHFTELVKEYQIIVTPQELRHGSDGKLLLFK
jgi:hypothetical protein